jgi:hypothetical protein
LYSSKFILEGRKGEEEKKKPVFYRAIFIVNQVCVAQTETREHAKAICSASNNPPPFVVGYDKYHHFQACLFWLQKTSSHSFKRLSERKKKSLFSNVRAKPNT